MHRLSAARRFSCPSDVMCPTFGCIGEKDGIDDNEIGYFLIDSMKPSQANKLLANGMIFY